MTKPRIEAFLNCSCRRFDPFRGKRQCRACGDRLRYFRAGETYPAAEVASSPSAGRPTPPDLVWTGGPRGALDLRLHAVRALCGRVTPRAHVAADVAGGGGRWLPHLAPDFDLYLHMDLSGPALRYAEERHRDLGNVVFVQNDLVADRQAVREIDLALCLDTLLYEQDFVPRALRSIRAMLRPGGWLIAEFTSFFHSLVGRMARAGRVRGPKRTFWLDEARRLSREAGFDVVAAYVLYRELPVGLNDALQGFQTTPLREAATWFYLLLRSPGDAAEAGS